MSGIFGIINLGIKKEAPIPDVDLETMRQALLHLGPDGSRILKDKGIALGHLAMHITPESEKELLPYASPTGRFIITADARLHNRKELVDTFSNDHADGPAIPDSLLILKAFEKWGKSCPGYLLGDFAFAIWDKREKQLFCAVDHLGIRPFFYYCSHNQFIFASQLKGIRRLPFVPSILNEYNLAQYLLVPLKKDPPDSLFKGIRRLKGARSLTLREGKISIRTYWTPEPVKEIRYSRSQDYADTLRELLTLSIHSRLRTLPGIQVGVTLSGGLDSSSIACIAARKLKEEGRRLTAVSSVLPENYQGIESDEREYIREVLTQESNIDIHYVTADGGGPFTDLDIAFEEAQRFVKPFHYMDRALWQQAQASGVRLLFSGEGGDHMASYHGNDSLYRLLLKGKWQEVLRLTRQFSRIQGEPLWESIKKYTVKPFCPPWLHYLYNRLKGGEKAKENLLISAVNPDFVTQLGVRKSMFLHQVYPVRRYPGFILDKLKVGHFIMAGINTRLSYFGIDGLFPFLDKRIVDFCLGVPPEQFVEGGHPRSLLRRAMQGILPEKIQWRKNKHPYTPDFHRRVLNSMQEMLSFMDTIKPDDPLNKYIDLQRIKSQFYQIQPAKGRKDWDRQTAGIVVKGLIAIRFLHWLEKHEY
jgi:asparagine synthase (glutamine-hydrolysing)